MISKIPSNLSHSTKHLQAPAHLLVTSSAHDKDFRGGGTGWGSNRSSEAAAHVMPRCSRGSGSSRRGQEAPVPAEQLLAPTCCLCCCGGCCWGAGGPTKRSAPSLQQRSARIWALGLGYSRPSRRAGNSLVPSELFVLSILPAKALCGCGCLCSRAIAATASEQTLQVAAAGSG